MISEMLENYGYQVVGFTRSVEALDYITTTPSAPDLLVTDLTMPTMYGDELSRMALQHIPELKIILCTGFHDHLDRAILEEIGISRIFAKPIIESSFLRQVRELLDS